MVEVGAGRVEGAEPTVVVGAGRVGAAAVLEDAGGEESEQAPARDAAMTSTAHHRRLGA